MGFFTGAGRVVIVFLNIMFVMISLVILAIGLVLKFLRDNALIKDLEDQLEESIKSMMVQSGNGNAISQSEFSLSGVFGIVGVCLIALGSFLLLAAVCGCAGACCKIQSLLVIYAGILIFLLLAEVSLVVSLYASSAVRNILKNELVVSLKYYRGSFKVNVESLLWNGIMREFQCCGVIDYKDFIGNNAKWDIFPYINGSYVATILSTPVVCCITIPTSADNVSCAESPLDQSKNNFNKGCFDSIWNKIFDNPVMVAITLSLICIIQIVLIVFTILMYKENKNNKVKPMEEKEVKA